MSESKSKKTGTTKRLRALLRHLPFTIHVLNARVVEWQTRTFEGRMPKGMRVQVPPRAPNREVNWFVR
jgi:hypothetical protein